MSKSPKKSEFYLHFWPLALHIGGAVGAYEKTAQKWPKKYQISKLAENPFKSENRLKPKAIPSFLGDIGLIKVAFEFSSRRAIFGHIVMGTFVKSAHIFFGGTPYCLLSNDVLQSKNLTTRIPYFCSAAENGWRYLGLCCINIEQFFTLCKKWDLPIRATRWNLA